MPSVYLLALLHDIQQALDRLITTGEPTVIDLVNCPLAAGDLEQLRTWLGQGEVTATVTALGPTYIHETRYSGVWWLDYHNDNEERIGQQLEITDIPQLLRPQHEDLTDARAAFGAALAAVPTDL